MKDNSDSEVFGGVAITGATVTISNNITYLTPATLSRIDRPIGSFTGSFDVSGSLQCYLDTKVGGSSLLWQKIVNSTGSKPFDPAVIGISDSEFLAYQASYIKNKLSILDLKDNSDSEVFGGVAITGATVTISNNITYLTPTTYI